MRQLSNLSMLSRVFFMGVLISNSATAQPLPVSLITLSHSVSDVAPADEVAQTIQAILVPAGLTSSAPLPAAQPHHQRLEVSRAVVDFYAQRSFRAAWTNDSDVAQLLKSLKQTKEDGLDPGDFGIDELTKAEALMHAAAPAPAQRARFDIAATRTYITALLQLRRGKVDPSRLEIHWNFDPVGVDPREDLKVFFDAVEAHRVARAFEQAPPQDAIYGSLREGLAQLRRVRDSGGWPLVPAGQVLKPGVVSPSVAVLRARLTAGGYLDEQMATLIDYDEAVTLAVKKFQAEQYLPVDGAVGVATLAALNIPIEARIGQVRVNMERARWLLYKLQGTFVVVDIAGYKIAFYRNGKAIWRSRVQVGKPFRSTPVFQSEITYVTFNPTWTVPPTILIKDILPKVLKDPHYLDAHLIRALDSHGVIVDPSTIDWHNPRGITLRQDAGPDNSLGQVVIRFPNDYSVYLHDTPHRDLFAQVRRATSSGCIRVENPLQLVELLFNDPIRWSAAAIQTQLANGNTANIRLPLKVPVLLAYWTVGLSEDGRVTFKPDVYGYDNGVLRALNQPLELSVSALPRGGLPALATRQKKL